MRTSRLGLKVLVGAVLATVTFGAFAAPAHHRRHHRHHHHHRVAHHNQNVHPVVHHVAPR